jgi:hypothetical protein
VAITVAPDRRGTPFDHGHLAVDLDLGAQAHQFVDVHEAVFKDGLGHRGRALATQLSAMNCACMSVGNPGIRWCESPGP